ncbi:hypothetical protein [Streptomyces poonensis]|uniref:Uncharacterized protein n=1 Tax=Streptomyces poonensis TaxID=68255 RepID=A0A918P690_9ACTN|nr:hypothetical protein [Streptomyces poonensis]GGY86213.1 hypothetical protein GCM10010365_00040 [Streptomyces poonensis]GLJ93788.1 hypothetical protein GCM10017589_64040 [Streptomyces poonensis]
MSVRLRYARREAWRHLQEAERLRALRTVRDDVLPLAGELRRTAPAAFESHRDALAVLLNECALAVVDEEPRPPVAGFGALRVRRIDPRDVDALLDAGRPGERPVIQQLFRSALDVVGDPVLREVITANQQGVHILQRANRWIGLLTDAMEQETSPGFDPGPLEPASDPPGRASATTPEPEFGMPSERELGTTPG